MVQHGMRKRFEPLIPKNIHDALKHAGRSGLRSATLPNEHLLAMAGHVHLGQSWVAVGEHFNFGDDKARQSVRDKQSGPWRILIEQAVGQ